MIRYFKLVLTRHESGYILQHDVMYFSEVEGQDYGQCDSHGELIRDPIFVLDFARQRITEQVNPEEFGPAKHMTLPIVIDPNIFREVWRLAANGTQQTFFTSLPLGIFTDLFHKETVR